MDIDQSLDAMIKAAPKKGGPKKKPAAGKKKTPVKKTGGGVRAKVIAKPRRGGQGGRARDVAMAVDDAWQHDRFQGGNRGPRAGGGGGGARLVVSNLHFNVTNADVKELFQQVGAVKKAGLNFDENGRSKGTAEIIFASPASAQKAIQTYNGVKLDGRPLKIELIGGGGGLGGSLAGRLSGVGAGGRTVTFNAGRGGSGGRGGRKVVAKVVSAPRGKKGAAGGAKGAGGRGAKGGGRGGKGGRGPKPKKATPMTQEQLDAQLDSYKAGAAAAPAGDVAMME